VGRESVEGNQRVRGVCGWWEGGEGWGRNLWGVSVMKANLWVEFSFSGGVVESAMGKNSVCNSVEFGRIVRFIIRRGICSKGLPFALSVLRVLRGFAPAIFLGNQKRLNNLKGHNAPSLHAPPPPPITRLRKQKEEMQFLFLKRQGCEISSLLIAMVNLQIRSFLQCASANPKLL
jgi:hypothetical protein